MFYQKKFFMILTIVRLYKMKIIYITNINIDILESRKNITINYYFKGSGAQKFTVIINKRKYKFNNY